MCPNAVAQDRPVEEPSSGDRRNSSEKVVSRPAQRTNRDPRIDVWRGAALLMIFADHIPNNALSYVTMRNFGFSDAAEVFVFLAGFSAMLAYGKVFERDGTQSGLKKVYLRLARIYMFQVGLLMITLGVVLAWTKYFNLQPVILGPIFERPAAGLAHALTLHAVPAFLDILPLYILLFAIFPLIYFGLKTRPAISLALSMGLWLFVNHYGAPRLPNWINGGSWYFNPFAWQFLFALGAWIAVVSARTGGTLKQNKALLLICGAYLLFAFLEAAPWKIWGLPNLQPIAMVVPDKGELPTLRLLNILAFAYVVMSSNALGTLAREKIFWPLAACGRHSLEVFAAGSVLALFGRLLYRTYGAGTAMQIIVNLAGLTILCVLGLYLEHRRSVSATQNSEAVSAQR